MDWSPLQPSSYGGSVSRSARFVGTYEDCSARPHDELRRLYEFLDLDPSFVPERLERRVNESRPGELNESVLASARMLYEADRPRIEAALPQIDLSNWS